MPRSSCGWFQLICLTVPVRDYIGDFTSNRNFGVGRFTVCYGKENSRRFLYRILGQWCGWEFIFSNSIFIYGLSFFYLTFTKAILFNNSRYPSILSVCFTLDKSLSISFFPFFVIVIELGFTILSSNPFTIALHVVMSENCDVWNKHATPWYKNLDRKSVV